jgi:hypothetical protein
MPIVIQMMSQTMVAWPGSCHSGSRCVVKLFISDTQNIVTSHLLLLDQILLAYSTSAMAGWQDWGTDMAVTESSFTCDKVAN